VCLPQSNYLVTKITSYSLHHNSTFDGERIRGQTAYVPEPNFDRFAQDNGQLKVGSAGNTEIQALCHPLANLVQPEVDGEGTQVGDDAR